MEFKQFIVIDYSFKTSDFHQPVKDDSLACSWKLNLEYMNSKFSFPTRKLTWFILKIVLIFVIINTVLCKSIRTRTILSFIRHIDTK